MTHRRAVWVLLGCTFIWGASFTLNKMVLGSATPLAFMAVRFAGSALLLAPIYRTTSREDWRTGLRLGTLFAVQLALFVVGLAAIDPARSAFLFSFQTPLVPVLMLALHRQWPAGRDFLAVGFATLGGWWLTRPSGAGAGFGTGDLATIGSAACAALYVVLVGSVGRRHEPMRLMAVQFLVMSLMAGVLAVVVERPRIDLNVTTIALIPFLALAGVATFVGQLAGQRAIRPTEAALLYALEPLVAAAVSFISLGERLSPGQWAGGGLILAGSFVAQLRRTPDSQAENRSS